MIRFLLTTGALLSLASACTQAAGLVPTTMTTPPDKAEILAGTALPPEATGFITANPLPLDPDAGEVRRDKDGRPYEYALLGTKLPHLTGTMFDGTPFDSGTLDQWTVIHVWGVWCPDSRGDVPYTTALERAIAQDPDLGFLSVHVPASASRTTPEDMFDKYGSLDAYFTEKDHAFPTLLDTDASLREALKIAWTPSYLLVSPDGTVKGYRSSLSDAPGEPVKDFIKDIARVKAEARQGPAGALQIGPDGAGSLPLGAPFTLETMQAAFPGYDVITTRIPSGEASMPAFEIREDTEVLLTITSDWTTSRVAQIFTTSAHVDGPDGERIGSFRLADLPENEQANCSPGTGTEAGALVCTDTEASGFTRIFRPDMPGQTPDRLSEMILSVSHPVPGE